MSKADHRVYGDCCQHKQKMRGERIMNEGVKETLARIREKDSGRPRKRVAVLGAGMAGLVAAHELSGLGHDVVIYEASSRIGGRVWTRRFSDGQYHEFGAMRFPASHDHTRYYANEVCGLTFRKFYSHHDEADGFYFIKNKLSLHTDYDLKLLPELELTQDEQDLIKNGPIPEAAKSKQLLNLLVGPLVAIIQEIKSDEDDLKALFGHIPPTRRILELETLSLENFLKHTLTSASAFELIGAVTGLEVWWDKAITMFIRDEIVGSDGLEEIVGGTSLLPETLVTKLYSRNVEVRLRHKVTSINNQRQKVQLGVRNRDSKDGAAELIDFDYVICTIPFSVLRRLKLDGLSHEKLSAIRNLTYASSTKVLLHCRQRFWETNYDIFGGGSQTDLISRSIYYPSDNAVDGGGSSKGEMKGLFTSYRSGKREGRSVDASLGSGVLVGSYNWGADARRLGGLSKDERAEVVKQNVSNIHPEIVESGMVVDHDSMFWDEYEWAGGAFCFMRPGDFLKYYSGAIQSEGNLFFAGEHCSLDQAWIQGALISSLRAVEETVAA